MPKVALTGSTGMVGQHMEKLLKHKQFDIIDFQIQRNSFLYCLRNNPFHILNASVKSQLFIFQFNFY